MKLLNVDHNNGMFKINCSFKKNGYIVLLILIGALTHYQWFSPFSRLFSWDWLNWPDETIKGLFPFGQGTYINFYDFGSQNIQVYLNLFYIIWGAIGGYVAASKLTIMIPIAILSVLSPYLLMQYLIKDKRVAFVSALFFAFNTNLLYLELSHLLLAFLFSLSPLILLFFIKLLDDFTTKNLILFSLIYSIGLCYELRIGYIMLFVLLLYFIIFINKKYLLKDISKYFLLAAIIALLNLFWFLPVIFSDKGAIIATANRGLFGDNFFNLLYSFADYNHYWSEAGVQTFILQNIPITAWLVPMSVLVLLLNLKKIENRRDKKNIIFFSVILTLGILLTKQSTEPFSGLYLWLYNNFPGFSLFREASKFFILVSIGYLGLFAYFLKYLIAESKDINKSLKFYCLASLCLLFLWNSKPLITGEVGYLFTEKIEPLEYETLNSYIAGQSGFFRTISFPTTSKWLYFNTNKPRVSAVGIKEKDYRSFYDASVEDESYYANFIFNPFKQNYGNYLADISNIKYFIVPLMDQQDDVYEFYGSSYREYVENINEVRFLKEVKLDGIDKIKIYENNDYKPYIFSLSEANGLESFDNLDDKYDYLTNEIKSEFAFYDLDKRVLPSRKLYVPFESITFSNIANDKINSTIVDNNDASNVYMNTGKKSVVIRYIADKIEVSKELKNNINFNGASTNLDSAPEILYASKAGITNYYAEIGSRLINIAAEKKEVDMGVVTEPFELFALSENNAIKNASFEAGGWGENVGDCNANDSNSILGMEVSNDASEGGTSVQLDATSHIACTGQNDILVDGGQDYLFGFDYQSMNAKNAGFYIEFNDISKTVISERLPVSNADWNTFQKKIEIPTGATKMNLVIYSYSSDNKTKITTKYDNFKLFALEKVTTIDPKYAPRFEKISIPTKNEYKIEYSDPNENFNNLIKNPSLEDGLWSEQVGDCNNYDSDGQLSMSQSTKQKTNGNYSLQLGATRHIACTGAGLVPVIENRTYLFSFDYQSPNGKEASYYLGFNDPENTVISEHLPIKDTGWHTFTKQIKAPAGASAVSLIVYSYAGDGDKEIINRYDNFSFIGLPDLEARYFFVTEPKEKLNNPASVEFELINPTKKKVHIRGATTAFYLAMSESYHPQWQAQMNNQKIQGFFSKWVPWAKPDRIEDDKHFELEGFLNGWYVDTEKLCANNSACTKNHDGSYDMEMVIEFFPQRWFYLGLLVSGTTLLGCIGYLGYDWRRRRKRRVKSNNSSGFPPARE